MKNLQTVLFLLVLCSVFQLNAQNNGRKYSNEFLSIGSGARGIALGNATTALSNDVNAAFYNPAGLLEIQDNLQVSLMHSEWFAGIGKYDYIGVGGPMKPKNIESTKKRAMAGTFIRFGVDNIANTLNLYDEDGAINYDNITSLSAADYAMLFSYAESFTDKLDLGANVKIIHRRLGRLANSWGFGLDLGAKYRITESFTLGLLAKDLTSTFNAWSYNLTQEEIDALITSNNEVPTNNIEITKPRIQLGIGYQNRFYLNKTDETATNKTGKSIGMAFGLDFDITTDGKRNVLLSANPISINPAAGLELDYGSLLFLRGGVSNFQKATTITDKEFLAMQPSAGLGIRLWNVRLDYTFSNLGDQQEKNYSHVVSLLWKIDYDFFREQLKSAG